MHFNGLENGVVTFGLGISPSRYFRLSVTSRSYKHCNCDDYKISLGGFDAISYSFIHPGFEPSTLGFNIHCSCTDRHLML